uniref:Uncharacterized protein n=1 Tax=Phytophthora ramorum TaxID=164328 RepID=H3G829_PHYRM
ASTTVRACFRASPRHVTKDTSAFPSLNIMCIANEPTRVWHVKEAERESNVLIFGLGGCT